MGKERYRDFVTIKAENRNFRIMQKVSESEIRSHGGAPWAYGNNAGSRGGLREMGIPLLPVEPEGR